MPDPDLEDPNTPDSAGDRSPTAGGASCCGSSTPASAAPGVPGEVQPQGALDPRDAAESGPHQQEEQAHACRDPHCAHSTPNQNQLLARNRSRKARNHKRTHLIASRFNDEEKESLLAAAAACAMKPSGFLAHAALSAARDLTRTAAEVAGEREVIAELFSLRRHLGQIGNNVNQVARALNSGADAPHAEAVLQAVHRAATRVDAFTQRYLDNETRAR